MDEKLVSVIIPAYNIEDYIGRKTLDGLFYMIAEKEKALRSNPMASGSSIIQQVFGK